MSIENKIHNTAIVDSKAKLGNNIEIGPYCIIGSNVTILDNTKLQSHVVIQGNTIIGENNTIFPFVTIGEIPQDLKYKSEESSVTIGNNNSIREHCTIHLGTEGGGMVTKIGNNNLFMVNTHIAHDCNIANNCVFANNATLAGHVEIEDNVVIGGLAAIHQYVKVGKGAMLGGLSGLGEDLIPYGMAYPDVGRRSRLQGLNLTGLKRAGFNKKDIINASHFYKDIFENIENNSIFENLKIAKGQEQYKNNVIIEEIITFLEKNTNRQFCTASKELFIQFIKQHNN